MGVDDLGDYPWRSTLEVQRAHTDEPSQTIGDARSPFERDRARIIHSVAFRRLQGKTQIFAPGSGVDFMRTRVTHSIEVAQIGRALAKRFKVPSSLVEAACLAHDLGHPPFGHTGEQALNEALENVGLKYEGNAQSFRIVTYLEEKAKDYEGLDLTRATLLGLMKYPYRESAGGPKFIYETDAVRESSWLFEGTGQALVEAHDATREPPRTIVCQLMDWSDDVAYSVHDLEDGVISGLLQPATWGYPEFVTTVAENVRRAPIRWSSGPPSDDKIAAVIEELVKRLGKYVTATPPDVLREVTRRYIDEFATAGRLVGTGRGETLYDFTFEVPEELRMANQVLKSITFEYVIYDARTTTLAYKGREIIRRLFDCMYANTQSSAGRDRFLLFPREYREELRSLADDSSAARFVADYIASLTEGQATALYRRLFEPERGSPFELV